MSDSYSGSESEDNRSNHDQFSDDREESDNREEESDSVSEQSDDDGDAESGGAVETSSIVGNNNLRLCPSHAAGSMTPDCKFCKAALGVISDNHLKKQLTQNSAQSGHVSRYAGRCDIQPATLTLGAISLRESSVTVKHGRILLKSFLLFLSCNMTFSLQISRLKILSTNTKTKNVFSISFVFTKILSIS